MSEYAWLEFDGGLWHLISRLFAVPEEATRRWSDSQLALTELMQEGWTVVRRYSQRASMEEAGQSVIGYGLTRQATDRTCDLDSAAAIQIWPVCDEHRNR